MSFSTVYPPILGGTIRSKPEDFIVEEIPLFVPSGQGEHLFLKIRKKGTNTDWLAGQLAKLLNVKRHDVGFAGLKDRNAVTTQWFSVYLPGKTTPDVEQLIPESLAANMTILEQTRHLKKLRRGALIGNRFTLVIRDCTGDKSQLEQRIQDISRRGIPNYFGEQRFGHQQEQDGDIIWGNITRATAWFSGETKKPKNRNQRSMYLSAARSLIFNHILSARIEQGNWDKPISGDLFMLGNSKAWFADDTDKQLLDRILSFDIHPSGALWGKGLPESSSDTLALETQVAAHYPVLCQGLEQHGLKQERRSMRIQVTEMAFEWLDESSLELSFVLPAGSYATVFLNQIVDI